jgi:hypothetical protein
MTDFDHILNWELKRGSHEFPGPAGGTCINEAAIVAAGFEYKKVSSWKDCPPCFSPVLSAFAILVNDWLGDAERNSLLMPLVTRLAGSAGESWVETARIRFILNSLDQEFLVQATKALQPMVRDHARSLSKDVDFRKAPMARLGQSEHWRADAYRLAHRKQNDAIFAMCGALSEFSAALVQVGRVEWFADYEPLEQPFIRNLISEHIDIPRYGISPSEVWPKAAQILTRAFEIGPRAPEMDTAKVVERLAAAKALAPA